MRRSSKAFTDRRILENVGPGLDMARGLRRFGRLKNRPEVSGDRAAGRGGNPSQCDVGH